MIAFPEELTPISPALLHLVNLYSTKTSCHGSLQVHHSVLDLVKANPDSLGLELHQTILPNLQPNIILLPQTLEIAKSGHNNSLERQVNVITQFETRLDHVEERSWGRTNHHVGVGGGSLWRARDLDDDVRKHCVDGVGALLGDPGYDLVEDFERVWAGSVGESCEVAKLGTLENVLIGSERVGLRCMDGHTAYLEVVVDSKRGKLDGTRLLRLGFAGLLWVGVSRAL
jgi:hypothetical protein